MTEPNTYRHNYRKMDAEIYRQAIEYERFTKTVYEAMLIHQGAGTVEVRHNVAIAGRSGVEHQIDVLWEFALAGVRHRVIVECKNYASNLTLEKARNFFAVAHDIGNCNAIVVTKTGFQAGAASFCRHYGISLKLLRKPTAEDFEGRMRTLVLRMTPRVAVSTPEKPVTCDLYMRPNSAEQEQRLKIAEAQSPNFAQATPSTQFLDKSGNPTTEEMRWWLPRQLDVLKNVDGGPYVQAIALEDHYLSVDVGAGDELVQVIGVEISYWVESWDTHEMAFDALDFVDGILKDFDSGEIEHLQMKEPNHGLSADVRNAAKR